MSNPISDPSCVTFALIGCGAIAPTHVDALAKLGSKVRLSHCCDTDVDKARAFAEKHGLVAASWSEILADPGIQAVTLCVPSGLHTDLAIEALRAGKHVIVEKPMDVSSDACDRLIAVQAETQRRFAVISQHRFDPDSQRVHRAIRQNQLGRIVLVEARVPWYRTQDYYDSGDWRGTWALDGGGCLMNQGVHTVDLMLWLCGPVKTLFAQMRTAAHERIEVEDNVVASLQFANGAIGSLMASTSCYPGFPAQLAIYGTEGTAILEGDELNTFAIKGQEAVLGGHGTEHALQVATGGTKSATAHRDEKPAAKGWVWGDAHSAQFADFVASIHEKRQPAVDGPAGRGAVALINAVYESARQQKVLTLS